MQRPQRSGNRVDEDRYHRPRRRVTEQLLQRLNGAVVDVHVRRYGDIDTGGQDRFRAGDRNGFGNVQRPFVGAVIAHTLRAGADAKRWHQLVKKAVVVVWCKDDDNLGVEVFDKLPCLGERDVNVVKEVLRRPWQIQQRAVGHTAQG